MFPIGNFVLLYDFGRQTLQINVVYRVDDVVHFAALVKIGRRFIVSIARVQMRTRIQEETNNFVALTVDEDVGAARAATATATAAAQVVQTGGGDRDRARAHISDDDDAIGDGVVRRRSSCQRRSNSCGVIRRRSKWRISVGGGQVERRVALAVQRVWVGAALQQQLEHLRRRKRAERVIFDDGGGVARRRQMQQRGELAILGIEFDEFVHQLLELVCLFGAAVAQRLGDDDQKVNDHDESAIEVGHVEVDLRRCIARIVGGDGGRRGYGGSR